MRTSPDHAALIAGLHQLVEMIRAAQSGLPALTQLLNAGGDALGASGMSLSEYGAASGRVVVATGIVAWAAGLRVPGDPAFPAQPSWEGCVGGGQSELASQLRSRGLQRMLSTRVQCPEGRDGLLCAYFTQDDPPTTAEHHKVVQFLGSCAAALYTDAARLPVADPVPTPVDRDLFLAVTSHELRTPVTAIKGFADTLAQHWDTLEPEARQEAVRVIRQRAGELAVLVDRMLFTALETDSPVAGPFDLVAALHASAEGLPDDLRGHLRLALPSRLPPAFGDRSSIPPVLGELVTNAVKYSPGEVVLEAEADGQTVLFRVVDHGPGIAPEHVERAFTRYWQAEAGDRRENGGAGLGLHLVRRIVERQKGWVSLRPRRSGGTVAEVRLLRADATVADESGRSREA